MVMDTKLTLKLDNQVIEKAKEYAASQKRSLSGMIESYLRAIISKDQTPSVSEIEISPFVKSLKTGVKIPADFDNKKAYADYLAEKYKRKTRFFWIQMSLSIFWGNESHYINRQPK
jgi:hypothetical protein